MRQIVFHRWAKRQLTEAGKGTFSLGRLAAKAQAENDPRLQALLLLYAHGEGRMDRLLDYIWMDGLEDEYRTASTAIGNRDIGKLALRGTPLLALPAKYNNVMSEFSRAHKSASIKADAKRELWEATRDLQIKRGIRNCDIYRALDLNPGNTNAYLKHGIVEKMSLKNAQRIKEYVETAPSAF